MEKDTDINLDEGGPLPGYAKRCWFSWQHEFPYGWVVVGHGEVHLEYAGEVRCGGYYWRQTRTCERCGLRQTRKIES